MLCQYATCEKTDISATTPTNELDFTEGPDYEHYCLLGYDTVNFGTGIPTFWGGFLPSCSELGDGEKLIHLQHGYAFVKLHAVTSYNRIVPRSEELLV
jgi:hypothetical protein